MYERYEDIVKYADFSENLSGFQEIANKTVILICIIHDLGTIYRYS